MDLSYLRKANLLIDLEVGTDFVYGDHRISEEIAQTSNLAEKNAREAWSNYSPNDGSFQGVESSEITRTYLSGSLVDGPEEHHELSMEKGLKLDERYGSSENKMSSENLKIKRHKKPPRPPRPSQSPALGAADQRLVKEISEIAMLKRARIERMKALKKMKNAKQASSGGNIWAMVVTIIFFLVILWQGVSSNGTPSVRFEGSPEASRGARSGFISVHLGGNHTGRISRGSESSSPGIVEQVIGYGYHGGSDSGKYVE